MVTHDWNAAYHHATQVLLLDGRQVGYGPPAEVLTDAGLREAFGHTGHAHAMLMG
jgi:zinc transport system ATP-binding protein